nr:MAG TPA: hypothetical protein [Caudoviricetes sp.]
MLYFKDDTHRRYISFKIAHLLYEGYYIIDYINTHHKFIIILWCVSNSTYSVCINIWYIKSQMI